MTETQKNSLPNSYESLLETHLYNNMDFKKNLKRCVNDSLSNVSERELLNELPNIVCKKYSIMQFITDTYLLSGKVDSINNACKSIKSGNVARLIILSLIFLSLLGIFLKI
tara:strand:+ start:5634 stop:5966 length:333 start_codon:yes stop_codon:yes gene_type:complete